ncbi:hypothetical protein D3C73_1454470 [compost metagenome]
MHPVSRFIAEEPGVRIAEQHVFSLLVKAEFVEMLMAVPFPDNVSFPVHFNNRIVQQQLI